MCVVAVTITAAACAVRLGGPSPEEYQAFALAAAPAEGTVQVAERIRTVGADLVLLAAPAARDSAWFAEVAAAAGLQHSGPGRTGPTALGFLTNLELLGDTSIVLAAGSGRLHMHDALYQIGENRLLDLMLVTVDSTADLRESVRSLLSYIATDVGATAALLLGLDVSSAQAGDSISVLIRAAYADAYECALADGDDQPGPPPARVRMFYGPSVRVDCEDARTLSDFGNPITARLVVGR
jgi:hypothetical protein